jgi:transcriptional regulator GlxA family with amidase domain
MDVAIVALDGVADLGLASVLQAFDLANALRAEFDNPPAPWRTHTVSLGSSVRTGHGHLVATTPLHAVTDADVVIVTATAAADADALVDVVSSPTNRAVRDWLVAARAGGVELAAACTGTFFLAESGVLDGLTATTSWWLGPAMRRRYPRVEVDESRTLCRTDGITTAGATLMHLDLTLALIADRSPALAETVSRYLVTGDRRTQSASTIPAVIARGDSLVAAFERWVRAHLDEPFAIASAATALNVTVRSLQRATRAEIGMSPRDFVDEMRLERATRLLQQTSLTVDAVATKVGYLNGGTLRSLYRRRRNRTIAEVRGATTAWT